MRGWTVVLIAVVAGGCGGASGAPGSAPAPAAEETARVITPGELQRDLFAFADDSMRGRETGTPDATRAAKFIADRLRALELEPMGDSLYYQRVPMQRNEITAATRFSVSDGGTTTDLALGSAVVPLTELGPGVSPRFDASGELVFGGYAIDDEKLGRHDLRGLDAEGKILVVVHGAPPGVDSATKAKYEGQAYIQTRVQAAFSLRPAAVLVLFAAGTRSQYDDGAEGLLRGVTIRTDAPETAPESRQFPMLVLGVATPGSPLLPRGWPNDDRPQPLSGTFTGHIETRHVPFTGYNVAGVIRGSDPRLARTYVAYGAHLDHIGIQHGMSPDSIANGADDDGSGSMSLLAIARAMRARHPKRSILFVWHTGEEKGLLGSFWFTEHPTVPIDSIVVQLNADMIGRNAPNELYVVGPGSAPNNQSKVIGAIVDSVNAAAGQPFAFNREYDRTDHPERVYYRSDHYNYARKGIPIMFFTTGLHADYHKVTDSPDKIAYVKLARVAGLMMDVGVAAANRPTRPK